MNKNIYFDNAATTFLDDAVYEAMKPYFEGHFGNPSSIYQYCQTAKQGITEAREQVAAGINASAGEIYFTSGGSESDNWAIIGTAFAKRSKGNHLITTKIEHHAVLHTIEYLEKKHGFTATYLDVDQEGLVNPEDLKKALTPETILVSVMLANNEIGTIQPVADLVQITKEYDPKIYFHTDAVQALGTIPLDVQALGVDLLTITAHKAYGPKGVGALYIKKGVVIDNLIHGGGQEKGKRAGTENVAGIVGFGKAAELFTADVVERNLKIKELRDHLINRATAEIEGIVINGSLEHRLPGNSNFSVKRIEGEALILSLDHYGIAASSGSACTSGSLDPSHVLLAIGLDHGTAHGSLRVSLGKDNTKEEIDFFIDKLILIAQKLRAISPL